MIPEKVYKVSLGAAARESLRQWKYLYTLRRTFTFRAVYFVPKLSPRHLLTNEDMVLAAVPTRGREYILIKHPIVKPAKKSGPITLSFVRENRRKTLRDVEYVAKKNNPRMSSSQVLYVLRFISLVVGLCGHPVYVSPQVSSNEIASVQLVSVLWLVELFAS